MYGVRQLHSEHHIRQLVVLDYIDIYRLDIRYERLDVASNRSIRPMRRAYQKQTRSAGDNSLTAVDDIWAISSLWLDAHLLLRVGRVGENIERLAFGLGLESDSKRDVRLVGYRLPTQPASYAASQAVA